MVLYTDSLLAWYSPSSPSSSSSSSSPPLGGIRLSERPDLLAAGQFSARVPGRPRLPDKVRLEQVIAVGGRRPGNKVVWFVTRDHKEVEDWMSAIASTLPALPAPSQQHHYGPPPGPAAPPPPPAGGKRIILLLKY